MSSYIEECVKGPRVLPSAKAQPILFSAPMIRALLAGSKTQTRRIMKPQPEHLQHHKWKGKLIYEGEHRMWCWKDQIYDGLWDFESDRAALAKHAPYQVGDLLWVREGLHRPDGDPWLYRADNQPVMVAKEDETAMLVWTHHKRQDHCPSMFMPRWASRITLEVAGVRCQRLQDITEKDARAEGIQVLPLQSEDDPSAWWQSSPGVHQDRTARGSFIQLWDSINGKGAWSRSGWVWAYSFRQVEV